LGEANSYIQRPPRFTSVEEKQRRISALLVAGRTEEAINACEAAIKAAPRAPVFRLLLAAALLDLKRFAEVIAVLDPMMEPGLPSPGPAALWMRGQALWGLGREDEAIEIVHAAIVLNPGDRRIRETYGRYCLAHGHFDIGWAEHENRLARLPNPHTYIRRWDGADLAGKRLLVVSEQGLGDTLQFVRFVPMLKDLGATVTAIVQPALLELLAASLPSARWTTEVRPEGPFDLRIDLLSLPLMFGTRLGTIPARVPYLRANPAKAAAWAAKIGNRGYRIGLAWQGSTGPMRDDERSLAPAMFAAIAQVPEARLISIQGIEGLDALDNLPAGMTVERLGSAIDRSPDGISEIAAVMQSLDLVITSDTMTAHLAGAVGRPVWVGLKREADWRWLRDRSDSPWYPTMRLFRQQHNGEWAPVVAAMTAALQTHLYIEQEQQD
jgi:tetratricopeptide (TPR) repeat protein